MILPQAPEAIDGSASPVFWGILVGYLVTVLGLGAWFARFNKSTNDFFYGGRRFAWWLITMSILATGVGSHSFVKYSGIGFEFGLSSATAYMNDWFFMPLFLFGWLPIVYYLRIGTIPEYCRRRFGSHTRNVALVYILVYMLGYIGIGFLTMAEALAPVVEPYGWSKTEVILVVAAVAGLYVSFGGQTAVIFTDLLQGFLLLFAGLILFVLGLSWLGGIDAFWDALPDTCKLPLANFNDDPAFNFVGAFWMDGIAGSIGFYFLNQALLMRFLACRSLKDGRKAAVANVIVVLPLAAIAVGGAGWVGRAIAETDPTALAPGTPGNEVFTRVAALLSSPAGFAFFLAAVTAALMSSVDTLINATAAVSIQDLYRRWKPNRSERHYLNAARGASVAATVVGVSAAFFFAQFDRLYEAHGLFHATINPPLAVAIFLGVFWRRFTSAAAMATFIGGAGLMFLGAAYPDVFIKPFAHGVPPADEHPYKYVRALYNLVACFSVALLVARFTKPKSAEALRGLTFWTLEDARRQFKGGREPNDRPGKPVTLPWSIDDSLPDDAIVIPTSAAQTLQADVGDLVYLSDPRWYLGGLRSTHARVHQLANDSNLLTVSTQLATSGRLVAEREVRIEREL